MHSHVQRKPTGFLIGVIEGAELVLIPADRCFVYGDQPFIFITEAFQKHTGLLGRDLKELCFLYGRHDGGEKLVGIVDSHGIVELQIGIQGVGL